MNSKLKVLCVTALMAGILTACASSNEPSEAFKGESAHEIFEHGKSALQDKSYSEAIRRFEALDVQYPFGPDTETAQLYLIYAYYMKEEYAMATAMADRFIRIHPTNPHVDYAYYMRGMSDYYQNLGVLERFFAVDLAKRDLTQLNKAYLDFDELVTRYPQSGYVPAAHQHMVYLRNTIANHQYEVAEFYYNHKAYVAAANRAADVVTHYEGAPVVPKALVMMIKSYHHLGETKLEQDAMRVLQYNYPGMKVDLNS